MDKDLQEANRRVQVAKEMARDIYTLRHQAGDGDEVTCTRDTIDEAMETAEALRSNLGEDENYWQRIEYTLGNRRVMERTHDAPDWA